MLASALAFCQASCQVATRSAAHGRSGGRVEPRSVTVAHARRLSAHVEMSRPRTCGSLGPPRSAWQVVRFVPRLRRARAFRAGTATAVRSAARAFRSVRRCVRARGGAILAQAAPLMVGWASSEERVPVEGSSPVVRASARQLAGPIRSRPLEILRDILIGKCKPRTVGLSHRRFAKTETTVLPPMPNRSALSMAPNFRPF